MKKSQVGLIGLGVMGANLALNLLSHGFSVSVYNRRHDGKPSVVENFLKQANSGEASGFEDLADFVGSLELPRKIILMVKAGDAVDDVVAKLTPLLNEGDIIIDGGNSDYRDTRRRVEELEKLGILFVGAGISGGAEGARNGPSIMVGGNPRAWTKIRDILQSAAASCGDGTPCCKWFGEGGVGHFVKMVHNGIEYADMQLIAEVYQILRTRNSLSNAEMSEFFESFNRGDFGGYLPEITAKILRVVNSKGAPLVNEILDAASQKGTGKWTVGAAFDVGAAVPTIASAVFERIISSDVDGRNAASKIFANPNAADGKVSLESVKYALIAAKILVYSQGFALMAKASEEFGWNLDFGSIARVWRKGCIIRSGILEKISQAYKNDKSKNFIFDPYFQTAIKTSILGLRHVVASSALNCVAVPCLATSLSYFDSITCASSPANLIQAQRDFFGAHTYERVDAPRGEHFHTDWASEIERDKQNNQIEKPR